MDHLGLPSGSRVAGHGEPETGPTRRQEQQARDEQDGDGKREPTKIDLLNVIATGMRQLQDAQTKAFQKKSSQEEPEPVKPRVTSLPTLKGPDPETSPVEVQDWLQLLQAPMSDLGDNSAEWWGRVQELAQRAYQDWSSATPMERLAMRAPREKELEEGRFARLNARAASMILRRWTSPSRQTSSPERARRVHHRSCTACSPFINQEGRRKNVWSWITFKLRRSRLSRTRRQRPSVTGNDGTAVRQMWE